VAFLFLFYFNSVSYKSLSGATRESHPPPKKRKEIGALTPKELNRIANLQTLRMKIIFSQKKRNFNSKIKISVGAYY